MPRGSTECVFAPGLPGAWNPPRSSGEVAVDDGVDDEGPLEKCQEYQTSAGGGEWIESPNESTALSATYATDQSLILHYVTALG